MNFMQEQGLAEGRSHAQFRIDYCYQYLQDHQQLLIIVAVYQPQL